MNEPRENTRRRGAPVGNLNAAKHGRRSRDRFNLVVGKGAKRDRCIIDRLRGFRAHLETLVHERHGEVSLMAAALINSATRWEKVAALADRWLREEGEKLGTLDRLSLARSVAQASDSRDKCIKALDIERSDADLWKQVYAAPLHATSPQATGEARDADRPADASGEAVGDVAVDPQEGHE